MSKTSMISVADMSILVTTLKTFLVEQGITPLGEPAVSKVTNQLIEYFEFRITRTNQLNQVDPTSAYDRAMGIIRP